MPHRARMKITHRYNGTEYGGRTIKVNMAEAPAESKGKGKGKSSAPMTEKPEGGISICLEDAFKAGNSVKELTLLVPIIGSGGSG